MIVADEPPVLLLFLAAPSHLMLIALKSHEAPQMGKNLCTLLIVAMNSLLNCSRKAALQEVAPYVT